MSAPEKHSPVDLFLFAQEDMFGQALWHLGQSSLVLDLFLKCLLPPHHLCCSGNTIHSFLGSTVLFPSVQGLRSALSDADRFSSIFSTPCEPSQ